MNWAFLSHLSHKFLPLLFISRIGNYFFGKHVFPGSLNQRMASGILSCSTNNLVDMRPLNGSSTCKFYFSHFWHLTLIMIASLLKSLFFLQVFKLWAPCKRDSLLATPFLYLKRPSQGMVWSSPHITHVVLNYFKDYIPSSKVSFCESFELGFTRRLQSLLCFKVPKDQRIQL